MYSFLGGVEAGGRANLYNSAMSNSLHMKGLNCNTKCMLNREMGHFKHVCKEAALSG